MSTEGTPTTKKRVSAATSSKRTSEDDHRRKRRNRPTQSCLNCHTSKRMCDRQRPCGRCTQLGLTGLCVYEVDNPSQRANAQDEAGRLKKRVAELESIIRELKNKPHPRWAPAGQEHNGEGSSLAEDSGKAESSNMPSSPSSPKSPRPSRLLAPPSPGLYREHCHSSSPSTMGTPSPLLTPSPIPQSPTDPYTRPGAEPVVDLLSPDYDFSSILASYQPSAGAPGDDALFGEMFDPLLSSGSDNCSVHRPEEHCGCLNDHTSYSTVLELSMRLRRATEILSRYAKHDARTECQVHKGISELDRFTTTALSNIISPPEPVQGVPPQVRGVAPVPTNTAYGNAPFVGARPTVTVTPASVAPHAIQSPRVWDFKHNSYPSPPWEDSFMSWEPMRH